MNVIKSVEESGRKFIEIVDREKLYKMANPRLHFEQFLKGYEDFTLETIKEGAKRTLYMYLVEKYKQKSGEKRNVYSKSLMMLEKAQRKVDRMLEKKIEHLNSKIN